MIKFCGNCGTTVTEKDIEDEKAITSGKYVYCKSCASKLGFTDDGPAPTEEEIFNAQDNMATAMIGPDQVNLLTGEDSTSDGDSTTAVLNSDLVKRKVKSDGGGGGVVKQEVKCGNCGVKLRIKMGDKPKKVRCPKCQEIFTASPSGAATEALGSAPAPAPEPVAPTKDGTEQLATVEPPSGTLGKPEPGPEAPAISENEDGVIDFPAPAADPEPSADLIDFNPAPDPEPDPGVHEESTGSQPVAPAAIPDPLEPIEPAIPDNPPLKNDSEPVSALEEIPVEKPAPKPASSRRASASSRRRRGGADAKAASGKQKKAVKEEPQEQTVRTSRSSRSGKSGRADRTSLSGRRSAASGRSKRGGRGKSKAAAAGTGKGMLVLLVLVLLAPALLLGVLETRERNNRLAEVGLKAVTGLSKIGLSIEITAEPVEETAVPAEGEPADAEKAEPADGEEVDSVEGEPAPEDGANEKTEEKTEENEGEEAPDENGADETPEQPAP